MAARRNSGRTEYYRLSGARSATGQGSAGDRPFPFRPSRFSAVGPEGDFTGRETAMALEAGFVPVTLGPIVLRVETAAFFGLAAMRYALD